MCETNKCCQKPKCEHEGNTHCLHFVEERIEHPDEKIRRYCDGGPNRRCCHCGKYESDLHGKFAPTYRPAVTGGFTWGTTTSPWTITTGGGVSSGTYTTSPANSGYITFCNKCNILGTCKCKSQLNG